ncbi:MAG: MGMT family protein [Candidatus Hodarchaeales archaeon]|jgi:O-6-methylguanine DNA methyltransferase
MSKKEWLILQKENNFIGVCITDHGHYSNTIPYFSKAKVEEKINYYFSDSVIVEKYQVESHNQLAHEITELIWRRWQGTDYNLKLDLYSVLDFTGYSSKQVQILKVCGHVPYGTTLSYSELARKAGYEGAARFAGTCMAKTRFPIVLPCHRITRANSLGQYGDDPDLKRILLEREGVDVEMLFKKGRRIKTPL